VRVLPAAAVRLALAADHAAQLIQHLVPALRGVAAAVASSTWRHVAGCRTTAATAAAG
jgi:hypothetical protein